MLRILSLTPCFIGRRPRQRAKDSYLHQGEFAVRIINDRVAS